MEPDSKAVYCLTPHTGHSGKGKSVGTEIRFMVAKDEGKGKGLTVKGREGIWGADENIL